MQDSTNFTFSNNTYTTTGSFQMHGKALGAVAMVNGITVTGNTITLNSYNNAAIGIYIFDVNNAEVSGNVITGGTEPIGIKGVHRSVTVTKVHDNQLSDFVTGQGS